MLEALTGAGAAAVVAVAFATLQTGLATITVPQAALADGKVLVAGTYDVRVTNQAVAPAPGESEGAERWVEFVANGVVAGREVATIIPDAEIANVADGPRPHRTAHASICSRVANFYASGSIATSSTT